MNKDDLVCPKCSEECINLTDTDNFDIDGNYTDTYECDNCGCEFKVDGHLEDTYVGDSIEILPIHEPIS
ncbi:MAG: hypothetical protein ACTSQY_03245 [Candidatus Odinarchaeia archaeon]